MDRLCEEISQKLNIYERNYSKYTRCLIRGTEILISSKPEERVRQILLYFLINESGLFPHLIDLKVESDYLDIAIYKNTEDENFKPCQPPILIIEVKREEETLLNHEHQILRYLRESRSEIGILFNGIQLISYMRNENNDFIRNQLKCITDIPSLILQSTNKKEGDFLEFKKAQDGNINSFIYLITKYGKYANNEFTFLLKNTATPIVGCFFSYDENNIYYDTYGKYSKRKFSFRHYNFEKLVSIIY